MLERLPNVDGILPVILVAPKRRISDGFYVSSFQYATLRNVLSGIYLHKFVSRPTSVGIVPDTSLVLCKSIISGINNDDVSKTNLFACRSNECSKIRHIPSFGKRHTADGIAPVSLIPTKFNNTGISC